MVIGIIPDRGSMESLLNNLSEADFSLKDVSVVMADVKARNAIARDTGPYKGVGVGQLGNALGHAGLLPQDAQAYADAVSRGKVFVAIRTAKGGDQAALEMLADYTPEMVRTL